MNSPIRGKFAFAAILVTAAAILAIATTYAQVNSVGIHFLRVQQEKVHLQMLNGTAGNPWQYRILPDLMLEPGIQFIKRLGVPQPESFSFIGFRFIQCMVILCAAGSYYRKLGLSLYQLLLGLSVLTWSMSYSLYNSDLSFNVFFDVGFYLLAASLILARKYIWIALLMIPAALNRETSLLIPFMLYFSVHAGSAEQDQRRTALLWATACLLIYAAIFVGLRLYYGQQQFLTADGYYPGLGLLALNIKRWVTWEQLSVTLGIVPLLAVFAYREWPKSLRAFFYVVVPAWFAVHFIAALMAETRLVLVPQALVFIPAALFGLSAASKQVEQASRERAPSSE